MAPLQMLLSSKGHSKLNTDVYYALDGNTSRDQTGQRAGWGRAIKTRRGVVCSEAILGPLQSSREATHLHLRCC